MTTEEYLRSVKDAPGLKTARTVTVKELQGLSPATLDDLGFYIGDPHRSGTLRLIPLWAWDYIAEGSILKSIRGKRMIKGVDEFKLETRAGCLAFGFQQVISTAKP